MEVSSVWLGPRYFYYSAEKESVSRRWLTVVNKGHHEERHQTPFDVVHEVAIAHPLLALAACLALKARPVTFGH